MGTDLRRVSEGASQATGLGSAKAPEPSGLGPTGAIPSACTRCGGKPTRLLTSDQALCETHRMEWLRDEAAHASEAQIKRVMAALDVIADAPPEDEWDKHLRKMAVAAIEAF